MILQLCPDYCIINIIVYSYYKGGNVIGRTLRVLDSFHVPYNNRHITILITDLFQDDEITAIIQSNIGIHTDFNVEHMTHCFSEPKSRLIGFFGKEDYSKITELKFI